jgi:hypothetical protein
LTQIDIFTATGLSVVALLLALYVRGVLRTYREARGGGKTIDRDVLVVLLLVVPLFRGAVRVLFWMDRLFFKPKVERFR